MSRYIDADNAIERLGAYLMADAQIEYGGMASEDINDWKELASDILKGTPSIDLDTDVWCEDCKEYDKEHHNCPRFNRVIRTALEDADMVRVVRCKECRYWNTKGCRDGVGECEWAYYMTKPNDFCSYGERSER